jgi:hypothetical protein
VVQGGRKLPFRSPEEKKDRKEVEEKERFIDTHAIACSLN